MVDCLKSHQVAVIIVLEHVVDSSMLLGYILSHVVGIDLGALWLLEHH